jgi:hypothetical protein
VAGKVTQFRKRDECYAHLEDTGVTRFRKSGPADRRVYEPYEEPRIDEPDSDGGPDRR